MIRLTTWRTFALAGGMTACGAAESPPPTEVRLDPPQPTEIVDAPSPSPSKDGITTSDPELVLTDAGLVRLPLDAAPSVSSLAPLFLPHDVWEEPRFFESAPDHPVPIFCIGTSPKCGVEVYADGARVGRVVVTRPGVIGPHGLQVGDHHRDVEERLTGCAVMLGDESGVSCRVLDSPRVLVVLVSDVLLHQSANSETPTPAQLADAKVARMEWSPEP